MKWLVLSFWITIGHLLTDDYEIYIKVPIGWAQYMDGKLVDCTGTGSGWQRFSYRLTNDSTCVTSFNALQFFKSDFDSLSSATGWDSVTNKISLDINDFPSP